MFKKKTFVITITVVFFIIMILLIGFERASNSPKYQKKFTGYLFNTFMILPDSIKSSIMILSGKRSFSNLFNDYNTKFKGRSVARCPGPRLLN